MANEFIVKKGLIVSGSAEIEQDLRVRGTLTVDEFHASITTSSILFESGSTKFGNDIGDNHDFTGSVSISGSISLNGQAIGTGKLDETTFNSFTSSYISNSGSFNTRVGNLETFSSSLDASFVSETEFGSYTSSINPRLTAIETSTGSLNSFSGSANTRLGSIETSTASLNSFTSSINTTIKNKLDTEGIVSGSAQININDTTGFSSFSSSIASTNLGEEMKLLSLETSTGSLNNFSSSANTRLGSIETATGSLNTFSSSANDRLSALESTTSSINTFTSSINTTINNIINNGTLVSGSSQINITGTTGYSTFSSSIDTSINTLSSSVATTDLNQNNRLNSLESASGSIRLDFNSYTSSNNTTNSTQNGRLDAIETSTGSLNSFSSSANTRLGSIETSTGSLNTFSASANNRLSSIETSTGSLNSYTSSNDSKIAAIQTATSSLNSFTSSINTTIKNKLNSDGVISGSIQVDLTSTTNYSTFSSSIATTDAGQDTRLNSIEGKTGSYATTGSNRFNGNQTITGSLIVTENLTVYGSSSITYVTASQLAVSNSFISVNVFEPAERFGGIKVYDSGSSSATASLAWDSLNNRWIYQNVSGALYNGAMLISGPRNTGSLGDEPSMTSGKIVKSVGGDHIDNSIMNETSGVIYITGSLSATGTVGGTNITAIESTTSSLNSYTASNDSTNTTQNNRLTSIETSTASLNLYTSSNTTNINAIQTATSSLNSFTSSINTTIKNKLNSDGVISGSVQISFGSISGVPSGLVSGSSQVLSGTTIHSGSFFNGISVVSGSAQISFGGITGVPSGLVSGSSQILSGTGIWSGSAQLPSGVVSGSSQVSFGSISGVPSGLVSGSSQITFGSVSGIPSGLVSGSSQITFGSVSGIPSGLVSGSSQITLSSTTGFGSYLNQAVLTSSTPTFSGAILTNVLRGGIGAAATTGTLNWNDSTNARSGQGYTLLTGNATNGPGPSEYFHPFSFEYSSWDGSGNMTQFAIPYNANQVSMYFRGRYAGSWGSWYTMWNSGNDGSGSGLDADLWDGYHFSDYLNQSVKTTSAPTFSSLTLSTSSGTIMGRGGFADAFGYNPSYGTYIGGGAGNVTGYLYAGGYIHDGTTVRTLLHSANYNSYSPSLTGGGASGTWSINVTGNAATVTNGVYTTSNNTMTGGNKIVIQNSQDGGSGRGIFMWNSSDPNWAIYMAQSGAGKALNDGTAPAGLDGRTTHAIRFRVATSVDQIGFLWENSDNQALMQLQPNTGHLFTRGYANIGSNLSGAACLYLNRVGGYPTIKGVTTNGGDGQIVIDGANNSSNVYLNNYVSANVYLCTGGGTTLSGLLIPHSNNTYDLGSSSNGWRNVYTNDLHLSNMGKPEGNDIDGTKGNWTIQEGAENLYIINNNNGKKFKISLEEIK